MTNSADPDQLALEANWSGSTLFAKTRRFAFSKRRVNYQASIQHLYQCRINPPITYYIQDVVHFWRNPVRAKVCQCNQWKIYFCSANRANWGLIGKAPVLRKNICKISLGTVLNFKCMQINDNLASASSGDRISSSEKTFRQWYPVIFHIPTWL